MLRSGWLLLLGCLVGGLVFSAPIKAAPLEAAEPNVIDRAGFFSKSAVDQAMRKIQEIHSRFQVDVLIETFPSIPDNLNAQYKPTDKRAFFRRWAETRAADEGVKGIYVLICKNPGHLQIEPDQSVRRKAFTSNQRDVLAQRTLKLLDQKQFDAALLEMANTIAMNVETNLGQRGTGAAPPTQRLPNRAPPAAPQQSSGLFGLDLSGRGHLPRLLAYQGGLSCL